MNSPNHLVPNPSEMVRASSPRGGILARLQPGSAGLFYSNNAARPPCAAFAGGVLPGVLRPLPNSRNATVRSHAPAVLDGGSEA